MNRLPPAIAAVFCVIGLGGCGFTPLYATPGVNPKLAAIEVARPDGRTGFLLGDALNQELAHDSYAPALYHLAVQLHETRVPRGININNVASRYELDETATYVLTDFKTHKLVTRGRISINVGYDEANQPYAAVAAQLDGEKRAAEQVAQRIRLDLATFFATPRPDVVAADVQGSTTTYDDRLQPSEVLSPHQRAASGADPGKIEEIDPYATPASDTPPAATTTP